MTTTTRRVIVVGLALAAVLAFVVSPFASSEPDGLERVAADQGIDREVRDHDLAGGPTADYAVQGVDNERLSTGLAGVLGVALTFLVGAGFAAVVKFRTADRLPSS